MTRKSANPDIISGSRRRRIAGGAVLRFRRLTVLKQFSGKEKAFQMGSLTKDWQASVILEVCSRTRKGDKVVWR